MGNRSDLWCLTTYFNPAHYKSRLRNHAIYVENMLRQNVNLMVIELAFGDDEFELPPENVIRLRAKSVLWQKERMLNYALTQLPPECKYVAWVDGDVLFERDDWADVAISSFEAGNDLLQMFETVKHLPPDQTSYNGTSIMEERSLVWQARTHEDFLDQRRQCKLKYATTGFAWAARKDMLTKAGGFYDKHVLGANDNVIIDCCLHTFDLHHYYRAGKGTPLLNDMMDWAYHKFGVGVYRANYLPLNIYHLFHGAKKNRGYLTREDIVKNHQYDPNTDIRIENNVYEWATDKPLLHKDVHDYFGSRQEDSDKL